MLPSTNLTTQPAHKPSIEFPVPSIVLDDCSYNLAAYNCGHCGTTHYKICRMAGAFPSIYRMPPDFSPEMFEAFVKDIHDTMTIDATEIIEGFKLQLMEVSSPFGIDCDGGYLSILQDFARERLIGLTRSGHIEKLELGTGRSAADRAIKAAFEFGYALSELRLKGDYEDAIFEGWRLQEGREAGQEAAAKAKHQQSKRTRAAILSAALEARATDALYVRNDTALARHIEGLNLDALKRGDGRSIGFEAILKHMRELRHENKI